MPDVWKNSKVAIRIFDVSGNLVDNAGMSKYVQTKNINLSHLNLALSR